MVAKADGPNTPTVTGSYTGDGTNFSYTVNAITDAEYSNDGATWQDSNVFSGITPSSSHTLYARIKETATHEAGTAGNTGAVTFAKLANANIPPLVYDITGDSPNRIITITPVTGAQYSFDGGSNWGAASSKDGYTDSGSVTIQIRYEATGTHEASTVNSVALDFAKQDQAAPSLTYTAVADENSITLTLTPSGGESDNYMYSIDGNIFTDLTGSINLNRPGESISVAVYDKGDDSFNPSPAATLSITLPKYTNSATVSMTAANFSKTQTAITMITAPVASNGGAMEYSFDNGAWLPLDTSNFPSWVGLFAETGYSIRVRAAGDATRDAGTLVSVTITTDQPPAQTYTISLSASPVSGGTVSGGGTKTANASVTVTASAAYNYRFTSWTEGGSVVSNRASYSFTLTGNRTLTANFTYDPPNPGGGNGGGGDSYYTPPTAPTITEGQPNMPTFAKSGITGTVEDNVLNAGTITKQMVKDAIAAAGSDSNGITIAFNVTGDDNYTSLTATFEREALEALIAAGVKHVQIGSTLIDLSLDLEALTEILSQTSGNISVTAANQTNLSDAAKRLIGSRPVFDITIKDGNGLIVSNLKGGTATIGIFYKPLSWEKKGNLFGVYVDGSGKPQLLIRSGYAGGKVIFERNSLSIYSVGYKTPAPAFTDTVSHWAKESIDFVASRELISGTGATAFSPSANITRADFIMALGKLSGANVSGYKTSGFTDVSNDNPAMPYIEWAVQYGIVQGVGNNRFAPASPVTREQMAVMLLNYASASNYTLPISRDAITFADDDEISSSAKDAVEAIQQAGVIVGKSGNLYDPQGNATRAEASAILHRFALLALDEGTARGWVKNDVGQGQYINTRGKAVTGWLSTTAGNKYWFDENGNMVTGKWLQISGKWYYFKADGKLAVNTTIDGYEIDKDGARK